MQPASEQRKVVTILFADVVGSTALASQRDPELVRSMMAQHFKQITEIAQAHSGTVEKFAGDAVMVVFGVPVVHDDDAERAVRAALEIRDKSTELEVRVGVNTGEAVTAATEDKQFMVSGDTVNVAARLQQGADAGEVVVGELTHQLTRNVIDYEARDPVVAKGKTEALTAFRALRPRSQVPVQARGVPGLHAPLVGRDRELRLLLDTFARAAEDRSTHLFTLLGAAGIGKSRLVNEALTALAGSGARVLQGRCLPYGRGITYWPLIEMLRQDTGISLSDEREVALSKLDRWLGELLADDPERPAIRARLSAMLALETAESIMPDTPAERVEKEIAWAVRRYMEAVAHLGPLIAVIDDVQWAEPPMLATIEQLTERVAGVPLVIVCVARPEFLESRAGWGAGKPNATTITLEPLNPSETETLIARLLEVDDLPPDLRNQIIERSAGTPLFCEEFLHMLIDEGLVAQSGGNWRTTRAIKSIRVPQTIQAVLAARLDLLSQSERSLLQAASVIGERFEMRQLQNLGDVEADLEALRRKGLVLAGDRVDDEYRFRHLLIRDAAYTSLSKADRGALHDRFRAVLEAEAGDPQQVAEILAYHAERAFTFTRDLRLDAVTLHARAGHAVRWLLAMADRARTRQEIKIVEDTLEAARVAADALPDGGGPATRARIRLLEAQLLLMKADYQAARTAAREAASLAEDANLRSEIARARLTEAWILTWTLEGAVDAFENAAEAAIEAAVRAGDVSAEIEARHLATFSDFATGRLREHVETNERLLEQARSIGDSARTAAILERLVNVEHMRGHDEAVARYAAEADALVAKLGLREVGLSLMRNRAHRLRDAGDFEQAEVQFEQVVAAAEDAEAVFQQVAALRWLGYTRLSRNRPSQAAEALDRAIELSESTGETWNRSELLGLRAQAALDLGDIEAADHIIMRALESLRNQDITAVSEVHTHLGLIRHAQGRDALAEAALREAVEAVAATEYHNISIPAGLWLAYVLAAQGRPAEAAEFLDRYSQKHHELGWHVFDGLIAEVQNLVKVRSKPEAPT